MGRQWHFCGLPLPILPLFGSSCGATDWLNPRARSEIAVVSGWGRWETILPIGLIMCSFSKASAGSLNTDGFTAGPWYCTTTLTWSPIFSANTETPAPEPF